MLDVKKEKMVYVKAALSQMDIAKNGRSLKDVRYINVRENIIYNFVVCVKNFLVSG